MSTAIGDAASLADAREMVRAYSIQHGERALEHHYEHLPPHMVLSMLRDTLLADTRPRVATYYRDDTWGGIVETAGRWLASRVGVAAPVGALAHRDIALAYHVDTQHPTRCWNLTVFFREHCSGGEVVVPSLGLAFAAQDRHALVFDAQRLHGVTPVHLDPGGYRISLAYYCPR